MRDKELARLLDEGRRKRAEEVRDKKLWQKALKIVKKYGRYDEHMADCYSIISYDLNVFVGDIWLRIHQSEYVMGGGEYIFIKVNNRTVFDVDFSTRVLSYDEDDPRVIRANNASNSFLLRVKIYDHIPEKWEKLLDGRKIRPALLGAVSKKSRMERMVVGRSF